MEVGVPDQLLNRKQVEVRVGLRRSAIYRMMRRNEFPAPLKLGATAVRWRSDEIESWIAGRPRATGLHPDSKAAGA